MLEDRLARQTPRVTEVRKGIYVVGFGVYIKIGVSTDVYERVASLQIPEEPKLYAILEGWINEERKLHRQFAEYRLRGEWFRHEGELAKWVIKIGTETARKNKIFSRHRAKLTESQVLDILAAKGVPRGELATKYGVSRSAIHNIRTGQNWKLVDVQDR